MTGEDRGAGGVLDLFRLDGRVVIVTGASSGLGVAFAAAFAQAGADLVVAARRAERLNATTAQVEATGRSCLPVPADVTDPAACQAVVDAALDRYGHVDLPEQVS